MDAVCEYSSNLYNSSAATEADLNKCRGLLGHLQQRVLGQSEVMAALCDSILAGDFGHTPKYRPRSFILILGPTGTGKTKAALEVSEYLYGTRSIARINVAEFSTAERVPLLLGTASGARGLLGNQIDELRAKRGRILLLDEIENGHKSVSDLFLGMEAAEVTLACGEKMDLSDLHIMVTSNLGSADAIGLEDVAYASLRRHVEDEAASYFRAEVFARFTSVLVFRQLGRDTQLEICRQLLDAELEFQNRVLSERFGHAHFISLGEGVYRRLVNEGYHRTLGARPMRNVIERRVRAALVRAQLNGTLVPGVRRSLLALDESGGLRALRLASVGKEDAVGRGQNEVVVNRETGVAGVSGRGQVGSI
jgi:ATP-dependent Clp protease ATP-binding subunit ClpA